MCLWTDKMYCLYLGKTDSAKFGDLILFLFLFVVILFLPYTSDLLLFLFFTVSLLECGCKTPWTIRLHI